MPFVERHADIELKRPVGLCSYHPSVDKEVVVSLVLKGEIALRLAGDIFQRFVGKTVWISEHEAVLDAKRPVDPGPLVTIPQKLKIFRIVLRKTFNDQLKGIPLRRHHMGKDDAAVGILLEDHGPFAAFRYIVFVGVEGGLKRLSGTAAHMWFNVDRVHVAIFGERKRKAKYRVPAVGVTEILAEALIGFVY